MKRNQKGIRKVIPAILAATLICSGMPMVAKADSSKVVTLGNDLTNEQKASMYEYFGTNADAVETITVTNQDERKYMEGIASEAQIGTKTYSCSYVEPTTKGGIQVKVANLTFVTSSMIASTLTTSGVENCNVVAASPIEVSGTGALTGIMMAYETASGETLDEGKKAAATEELVTTGELADDIGQEQAANLMNDVKEQVIEDGITDEGQISDIIQQAAKSQGVTLTDDQMAQITGLMTQIGQYDYDVKALQETLDNLSGKEEGFIAKIVDSIKGIFGGNKDAGGIINNTNDAILGADAVIDSTLDAINDGVNSQGSDEADESGTGTDTEDEGFFSKITNFFKGLFGGDDTDDETAEETSQDADAVTPEDADTSDNTDTADDTDAADTADTTDTTGTDDTLDTTDNTNDDASAADDSSDSSGVDGSEADSADTSDGTAEEAE